MEILRRNDCLPVSYCHEIIGLYSGLMTPAAVGEGKKKTYRSGRKALSYEMKSSMQLNAYTTGLAKLCATEPLVPMKPMHCDLICYQEGDGFVRHRDASKKLFTCIYFLNDSYEGGELCFDIGHEFKDMPAGSAVIWRNTPDSSHWVNEVTKGQRYVLAHWLEAL